MGLLPDARTLVDAVARYLEQDLIPTLDGYHRFQTRIAVNVLRTVGRELALAPRHDAEAHARLVTLLGHDGEPEALDAELAACVLDGERALDDPALVDHLRRTLHAALSIDNPKWASDEVSDAQPSRSSR